MPLQEHSWVAPKKFSYGWGSLECLGRALASRELGQFLSPNKSQGRTIRLP